MHMLIMFDGSSQHQYMTERVGWVRPLFRAYHSRVTIHDLLKKTIIVAWFGFKPDPLIFQPVFFVFLAKSDGKQGDEFLLLFIEDLHSALFAIKGGQGTFQYSAQNGIDICD